MPEYRCEPIESASTCPVSAVDGNDIGGQVDFICGAARSRSGRPIIAIPRTARNGTVSRTVPILSPGAGIVTSRGDVHHVVTEYGRVDLFGVGSMTEPRRSFRLPISIFAKSRTARL
jgi:hypothetical protein